METGNKYASKIRTIYLPNTLETTIAPPANLTFPTSSTTQSFWINVANSAAAAELNQNSSLSVLRVGLFCNFADGLVLATPGIRPRVTLSASAWTLGSAIAGNVATTRGSKTITGTGTDFTTDLSGGDTVRFSAGILTDTGNYLMKIASIAGSTTATMSNYAPKTLAGATVNPLSFVDIDVMKDIEIPKLNCFVEVNQFLRPLSALSATPDLISISGNIDVAGVEYHTKTVDTSFSGDTATFDLLAEIEYTGND